MKHGQFAGARDSEDCPFAAGSTRAGCGVEISVRSLDERRERRCGGSEIEGVKNGEFSLARDPEDRAFLIYPSVESGAVEVAVDSLHERGEGIRTVGEIE